MRERQVQRQDYGAFLVTPDHHLEEQVGFIPASITNRLAAPSGLLVLVLVLGCWGAGVLRC